MKLLSRLLMTIVLLIVIIWISIEGIGVVAAKNREVTILQDRSNTVLLVDLLDNLARRVSSFERTLPDFVVREVLTQEAYKTDGKLIERNVTVSLLTGRQLRVKQGKYVELGFKELRQVQSINGKVVKSADISKLNGIQVGGAFSSILLAHFAPHDQRNYNFDLLSTKELVRDRSAYLIAFTTREEDNEQYYFFDDKRYQSEQRGRAWVDAKTLTPLRIEYQEMNLPKDIKAMFYAVDYTVVQLGEETFVLPTTAYTEVKEEKIISSARHDYSDYKKFSTDIKIEKAD